jgi:hypothetical protein
MCIFWNIYLRPILVWTSQTAIIFSSINRVTLFRYILDYTIYTVLPWSQKMVYFKMIKLKNIMICKTKIFVLDIFLVVVQSSIARIVRFISSQGWFIAGQFIAVTLPPFQIRRKTNIFKFHFNNCTNPIQSKNSTLKSSF